MSRDMVKFCEDASDEVKFIAVSWVSVSFMAPLNQSINSAREDINTKMALQWITNSMRAEEGFFLLLEKQNKISMNIKILIGNIIYHHHLL